MRPKIKVEIIIDAPIEKIWKYWTEPKHIQNWYNASSDWHAPHATNDLKVDGKFITRMESRDGKSGFDFKGTYIAVDKNKKIEYVIEDGRKVEIKFIKQKVGYKIVETFEAESENTLQVQKAGWQAILNNFKEYVTAQFLLQ